MSSNTETFRKWYTKININLLMQIMVWITLGVFYLGVHQTEMQTIKDGLKKIDAALLSSQIQFDNINDKISLLENSKNLAEQHNVNFDKQFSGLDLRVLKIEESILKIALLAQQVETIRSAQVEIKADIKTFPQVQFQIAELKSLIEKSILKSNP